MIIRPATAEDLESINEIYNQSINSNISTAHTEPVSMQYRQSWFEMHIGNNSPIFVAETGNQIAGWLSLSPYRLGRGALSKVAEISYYIHKDFQSQGIGSMLMKYAISECPKYNIKNLIAILIQANIGSIKLLEKYGFTEWGRMPAIVEFKDNTYDHLYYGKKIIY
jgi:L-amino acid N-acyltransferase YncA